MATVTFYSDFGAQENKMSLFPLFPRLFVLKWWDWTPWSSLFECWVLSQIFHSPLLPSSEGSLVPLCFLPLQWLLLLFSCSVVSSSLQPHGLQSGLRVLHHLPEIAQSHVHWVRDSIQPSCPLSSPSPPAFYLSQPQGLFQWVGRYHLHIGSCWYSFLTTIKTLS